MSRQVLGPIQPLIQWVQAALSLGHEADHSPLSSAEAKEYVDLYLPFPNTLSWHDAQLKAHGKFQMQWLYYRNNHHSTVCENT